MTWEGPLKKIDEYRYEIPSDYKGAKGNLGMRTSGLIYASGKMIENIKKDNAPEQVANVATLPGIVGKSMAMPDIHWGYGFPIGGVAGMDAEEGVISPGGVGYDINCISGESKILHEFGYTMKIKDFENKWKNSKIKCMNFTKGVKNTDIIRFLKFNPKGKVYQVNTFSGIHIISTEDHPFYTERGMVELKDINNEQVAVYPFEGVEYDEPSDRVIIDEKDVIPLRIKKDESPIIRELKNRGLLPLKENNPKLPYLLKIMGYILGDGTMYFTRGKGTVWFYGKPENLQEIREDIFVLGYTPSKIYSRKRTHKITTMYKTSEFTNVEYSFKTTASSLVVLLSALGIPLGNKTMQKYWIPKWLFSLKPWQKRLFMASLFGAELSSPKNVYNYNFYAPILSMNKSKGFVDNGKVFLKQLSKLLKWFGVDTTKISKRKEYISKNGRTSYRLRLELSSKPKSLINLWSKIGFEYNRHRQYLASVATQYIKLKEKTVKERERVAKEALRLKRQGTKTSEIYDKLKSRYVNRRFIERSLYEPRKTPSRTPYNFPRFVDFMKKATRNLGSSGMVWDEIVAKDHAKVDHVYDFTVKDRHHNFIANNFMVSNCGVRLVKTNLTVKELSPKIKEIVDSMFYNVPSGVGSRGKIKLNMNQLDEVLENGAGWAVSNGYGWSEDLKYLEENGRMKNADPSKVSSFAKQRGLPQLGSLGAGNHFLEIDRVDEIFDEKTAKVFGIEHKDQIMVLIHTGSRGCGHQICTDHLKEMERAVRKYNFQLPDRELACAPVNSPEAENYFKAMACGANYAWTNRQMIVHWVRESFEKVFNKKAEELDMHIVYDVCHNIAKLEEHEFEGKRRKLYVHRKGATRAFPKGHPGIPEKYKPVGQPVLIPGDMGTASYVLVGTETGMKETFGSTCHGAGRLMSRNEALRRWRTEDIKREMDKRHVYVHSASKDVLVEEAPDAYKDIDDVVNTTHGAGISLKVAKLKPLGVVKG